MYFAIGAGLGLVFIAIIQWYEHRRLDPTPRYEDGAPVCERDKHVLPEKWNGYVRKHGDPYA